MLYWLDNNENHRVAVNENYGRELLELFSMGIGNYTEQDVKECARAFTGWTVEAAEYMTLRSTKASIWPYGRVAFQFEYRSEDHDESEKEFLGERGRFDGRDIIRHHRPAARDRQVSWPGASSSSSPPTRSTNGESRSSTTWPGPTSNSDYEIKAMLRTLFLSDYFRSEAARFARVKSPVELVAGVLRITQEFRWPKREIWDASAAVDYMGQELLNPPSVEGWHEGSEWIDSGSMVERINFGADHLGNGDNPGVRACIDRLRRMNGESMTPVQGRGPLPRHSGARPGVRGNTGGPGRARGEERRRGPQRRLGGRPRGRGLRPHRLDQGVPDGLTGAYTSAICT